MSELTEDTIRRLLEIEAKATQGEAVLKKVDHNRPDEVQMWIDGFPFATFHHYRLNGVLQTRANAEVYTAARNAIRPLCEEVLRLRAERDAAVAEAVAKEKERAADVVEGGPWPEVRGVTKRRIADAIRRGE